MKVWSGLLNTHESNAERVIEGHRVRFGGNLAWGSSCSSAPFSKHILPPLSATHLWSSDQFPSSTVLKCQGYMYRGWTMKLKHLVLDHNNLLVWCRASFCGQYSVNSSWE
ncbi:hypothetical protein AMECASPLE_016852 [Ameca splendens]|uniref:Uncharacterized protein n=1 Tax=Ameca splendens TaxID=208324 RepID=A0ABV0ZBE5_9TELE